MKGLARLRLTGRNNARKGDQWRILAKTGGKRKGVQHGTTWTAEKNQEERRK